MHAKPLHFLRKFGEGNMERGMVGWEKRERTAVITLHNPPVNVINAQLRAELKMCLKEAAADEGVTTLVLTGAGKAFMAGADINGFSDMVGKPRAAYEFVYDAYDVWFLLESIRKPTIAAINGLALGAGLEMALCCDIRIASQRAKLGLPEIKLGLFPGGGGTQRLPRLIGSAKAKELIFLGEPISADEALQLGLVNRVVPDALADALEMAEQINAYSLVALEAVNEAMDQECGGSLRAGIELEARQFQSVFLHEDVGEGVQAFLEKREPIFKNR